MKQKELLAELDKNFAESKEELKLQVSLDELDEIFNIRDLVLKSGYVSTQLPKTVSWRIIETFNNWLNYLHSLVMPMPHNMISNSENQVFSEKEKQEIINLMNTILAYTSSNTVAALENDKEKQRVFIDNSLKLWNCVQPKLLEIMTKVNSYWNSLDNTYSF